jgi:hypothetical protein
MDVDAPGFEADFSTFRDVIRELERRLGALIMQARNYCSVEASLHFTLPLATTLAKYCG